MSGLTLLHDVVYDDFDEAGDWVEEVKLHKGTTVYVYTGPTYGVLGPNQIPVTAEPGKTPFYGVHRKSLAER